MKKILYILSATALFAVSASAQTVSNGTFEAWVAPSGSPALERPNSWNCIDKTLKDLSFTLSLLGFPITPQKQCYKVTDAFEGNFAAKVQTKNYGDSVGNLPGLMSNSKIDINILGLAGGSVPGDLSSILKFTGGTPTLQRQVDSISAYVKINSGSGTGAIMFVNAYQKGVSSTGGDTLKIVGGGISTLSDTSAGYHRYVTAVVYTQADTRTDTTIIFFVSGTSSDTSSGAVDSSSINVDKVEMYTSVAPPTSIGGVQQIDLGIAAYPNPAVNSITFFNKENKKALLLTIFNNVGKMMHQQAFDSERLSVDLGRYATGNYIYTISNGDKMQSGKFIKQ